MKKFLKLLTTTVLAITLLLVDGLPFMSQGVALAQTSTKPNILVIMGDDIGWFNISAYNDGIMGYRTPNIDKLAKEGVRFTDFYGEQSCTAGRAAFITGQATIRTGMTKVGIPGVTIGLQAEDPTLADLLKLEGYTTGQFGKNHLGDLDQFLPTAHGFDEFYGNLYHLNAEEEPENEDYPPVGKDPYLDAARPRGVLHSYAGKDSHPSSLCKGSPYLGSDKPKDISPDPNKSELNEKTLDQRICDTGPLTKERMETVDEEFLGATKQFITNAKNEEKPFFAWFNTTRMHVFTHLKDDSKGVTGQGIEADGMVEHDGQVGELVQFIKDQGLDDNTIIIYTTDNGAEVFSWPDGGTTPFRSEKNTNWEGAFRIPAIIRWKGHIPEGVVSNDIMSHLDWVPTLMAAAGVTDIKQQLLKVKDRKEPIKEPIPTNKYEEFADENKGVHLDGYNFLPYLTETKSSLRTEYPNEFCHDINTETRQPDSKDPICSPRHQFVYLTDDGYPAAMRYDDWKLLFSEQRAEGFNVWEEPFVELRVPKLFNLRRDPFEKAYVESDNYVDWRFRRIFLIGDMQIRLKEFLDTFKADQYPPRQRPATLSVKYMVDEILKDIQKTYPTGGQSEPLVMSSEAKLPSEFGVVVDQLGKIVDKLRTISNK
ncbi:arylsulfatase [Dolichospermum lemmermannii CS-548]|uniref:arylsulfatase n=1 Tax=Dolichospermum lemmermannii TaxID=54295 RepID=UPI00232ADEED|nr:arylsulfatase [Dolichospermum lemmermannii]MDB9436381.1 arylsulfatase [Dolichospermum lemmermannii CS-548]